MAEDPATFKYPVIDRLPALVVVAEAAPKLVKPARVAI